MVTGPETAAGEVLVVYNVDNAEATLTIETFGPDGPITAVGYEAITVPPGSIRTIDLAGDEVVDRHVRVTSTTRVFVERSIPNPGSPGRTSSWLVPAN